MRFDFSSFIQGKTSEVVFLWKYISIIYIYFLQISQSAASPAGQEREHMLLVVWISGFCMEVGFGSHF